MSNVSRLATGLAVMVLASIPLPSIAQDVDELTQALEALKALEGVEGLEDPENVMAWVSVPRSASKGESIVLRVEIENARPDRDLRLTGLEIGDEFLSGFKIVGYAPEPRNKDHSLGSLSLEYPIDIPPGEAREFTIKLRAKKAGVYIGDVDIMEGENFLTRVAQTRVE